MRKLIFNLHLYATLVVGIFVVILGLTGAVMAFEGNLDRFFNRRFYDVTPQQTPPLPLSKIAAIAARQFPGTTVVGFGLPDDRSTAVVAYLDSGVGVSVNGYNGAILGTRRGPSSLLLFIHQMHLRLVAGRTGEAIMSVAGIVTLFLVISGVILWWKYKRFAIRWDASLFRVMFDVHNAAGILSLLFLLLLSVTGVALSFEGPISRFLYKSSGTRPVKRSLPSTPRPGAGRIDPDQAVRIAAAAQPGTSPLMVQLPTSPDESYVVRTHYPEDHTPGGRSWVCLDQYSGNVLVAQSSRTAPLPVRTYLNIRQIHTGDIGGVPSRVIMSASSLALVLQAFSGVVMWWTRKKKAGS